MPPRKNPDLKQGKLSFASKRNSSTATAAGSKKKSSKSTPSRKASRTSPSPASATEPITNVIDISSSSDDSADEDYTAPAAKKRRLNASGRARKTEVETVEPSESDKEKEPLDVKDKRWRKAYGLARNKMGNIKPVHTEGQSMVHHILRVFDLSYEYGPCVGMSRLDRWERAHALGLNPPLEVKEILLTKEGSADEQFSQSVFHGEV
ncbi:hypothetical protein ACG7TL_005208 [Trametes sanguinea]